MAIVATKAVVEIRQFPLIISNAFGKGPCAPYWLDHIGYFGPP
jgi:hypothetical protein